MVELENIRKEIRLKVIRLKQNELILIKRTRGFTMCTRSKIFFLFTSFMIMDA